LLIHGVVSAVAAESVTLGVITAVFAVTAVTLDGIGVRA
jgi:hypothetical protein